MQSAERRTAFWGLLFHDRLLNKCGLEGMGLISASAESCSVSVAYGERSCLPLLCHGRAKCLKKSLALEEA